LSVTLGHRLLTLDYSQWDLTRPDGEAACIGISQFARDRGNMVDEAEVLQREELRRRRWVEVQVRERKAPSALPAFDLSLDLRGPKQIRLLRSGSTVLLRRHVHIRATAVVLRAVSAGGKVSLVLVHSCGHIVNLPLGEILVATNVSTLAGLTTFARLGVTAAELVTVVWSGGCTVCYIPPPGRSTTWASHLNVAFDKE
jgi:hypothetical protein